MRIIKEILMLAFYFICVNTVAQIPVWQGFQMDWTYNHRISRLGSYISNNMVVNTAATGLGKDSGWFSTHYISVPETGIKYNEFEIRKNIEARENQMIQFQIDTVMSVSFHHSIFYLNGFDLIANNDADKLQLLEWSIKMVKGNNDTTFLRINLAMMFNCQSIECDWLNNDVEYTLKLYFGAITFTDQEYISYLQGEMYNAQDTWTRKLNNNSVPQGGNAATPRFITHIKFSLDKAHWYSGIHAYINESN